MYIYVYQPQQTSNVEYIKNNSGRKKNAIILHTQICINKLMNIFFSMSVVNFANNYINLFISFLRRACLLIKSSVFFFFKLCILRFAY